MVSLLKSQTKKRLTPECKLMSIKIQKSVLNFFDLQYSRASPAFIRVESTFTMGLVSSGLILGFLQSMSITDMNKQHTVSKIFMQKGL